jgi:peptidoglycan/LPS O-acetylase OafA/YrhL
MGAVRGLPVVALFCVSLVCINASWTLGWASLQGLLPSPRLFAGVVGMVGVALLLVLTLTWPRLDGWLSGPTMHWLGTRSYSLYLVHLPVVYGVAFGLHLAGAPWWFVILVVGASCVSAELFFRACEQPTLRLIARLRRPSPAPVGAPAEP